MLYFIIYIHENQTRKEYQMKSLKRIDAVKMIEQAGFEFKSANGHYKYQCRYTGLCIMIAQDRNVSPGVMRHITKQIALAEELKRNKQASA
jgi:predicted RNA binding protein YcfA (HicA-like mRNA interferase family)